MAGEPIEVVWCCTPAVEAPCNVLLLDAGCETAAAEAAKLCEGAPDGLFVGALGSSDLQPAPSFLDAPGAFRAEHCARLPILAPALEGLELLGRPVGVVLVLGPRPVDFADHPAWKDRLRLGEQPGASARSLLSTSPRTPSIDFDPGAFPFYWSSSEYRLSFSGERAALRWCPSAAGGGRAPWTLVGMLAARGASCSADGGVLPRADRAPPSVQALLEGSRDVRWTPLDPQTDAGACLLSWAAGKAFEHGLCGSSHAPGQIRCARAAGLSLTVPTPLPEVLEVAAGGLAIVRCRGGRAEVRPWPCSVVPLGLEARSAGVLQDGRLVEHAMEAGRWVRGGRAWTFVELGGGLFALAASRGGSGCS